MAWREIIYQYDGSFEGLLCCVFESYAHREIPAEVCPPEEGQLNFFGARDIPTDPQRARRVAAGLERLGAQVNPKVVLSVFAAKLRTV